MTAPTPGPWESYYDGERDAFTVRQAGNPRIICDVRALTEEDAANMELICAAPALREAILDCLAILMDAANRGGAQT